ncbi:MAG: helix-turn-helix transcriptional regulator [Anaerolineales bacterium]|nr:helix-turn-helix transcriptional regulator [Anaerolineales bacterium]
MCDKRRVRKRDCRCGCQVRGFIQPRLLLLLAKQATHGYDLMDALRSTEGLENLADPGMLYRTLRQFEEEGLVSSTWDTPARGPARRVYQLTAAGREYLEWWSADIRKTRDQLGQFLAEYASVAAASASSQAKPKRRKR